MTTQENSPGLRELVEFRERYGLEAMLIWCCAETDLPVSVMLYLLRVGRHFGSLLAEGRCERSAVSEMMRRQFSPEILDRILDHTATGHYLSLEAVRKIAESSQAGPA